MGALLTRIVLIAGGLGAVEIGLTDALGPGAADGWLLVAIGMVLLVVGTVGFMARLFGVGHDEGGSPR